MKNIRFHSIVTVIVMLACLASIFPMEENLRLGKDLAGGVSLIYTIDVKPDDSSDTVDRTINVLKDRINPQGLFEISFQQMGRDRIEITMPLPNEKVRKLRAAYDASLAALKDYAIDTDTFLRAMRQPGAERDRALEALMDSGPRRELLTPVRDAVKKAEAARAAFDAAKNAGPAGPELDSLLEAAGEAEAELERARDRVLASTISSEEFRAALELPDRAHRIQDPKTKEIVEIPSPRQQAISGIRDRIGRLNGASATIDAIIAAHATYAANRRGLDDPSDLVRMLQGAGVLSFRIAVAPGSRPDEQRLRQELRERGPGNVKIDGAGWYRINSINGWYDNTETLKQLRDDPASYFAGRYSLIAEERDGLYYVLLHDAQGLRLTKAEGDWSLRAAFQTGDQLGRPAIGFRMDPKGASLMGDLTERNQGRHMAIVLDDQVYSAPRINSRIAGEGIIEGVFTSEELNYLIKTMSAGSLQAKLGERPISQSVLAPELGTDNLRKGLDAAWISLIAIGVFMIGYYFFSGAVAMVALVCNAIMLLGIMSLNKAAFTLPGIAGVILTFGTAVDSNVLIYERIREELLAGNDVRTAVRVAFKRVGSTIIDANLTNLIVCLVLVYTGTQEIKGFGITLGIGVIATLFCAIIVTRLIFVLMVDHLKAGRWCVNQLPVAWPGLQRMLTPNVDWMRLFPLFVVVSIGLVGMGIGFVVLERDRLLDSEFRGGTSITLQLKENESTPGRPMTLTRGEVEERVRRAVKDTGVLSELRNAEIVAVNPRDDGVTSDRFTIRTTIIDEPALREAISESFGDVVASFPAIKFAGSEAANVESAPVYPIAESKLGLNIGRPEVENDVGAFLGGVAIVLKDMDPQPTRATLESRLFDMRSDPAYSSDALRRQQTVVVLDGTNDAVRSAAVVVHDSRYSVFEDEARWRVKLASQEWQIVHDAIAVSPPLTGLNSFSPAIAATFRAQAIIAVLLSFVLISIYVWVRFGSVRYSLAAVLPVVHDSMVAIGFVALAEVLYYNFPWAASIGIRPIKIDLGMVAAIMTIIGYSLNDTIVILDRIRENRGKLAYASKQVINDSVNQTMSRTLVTAGTALVSLFVLFFVGGEGVSSFAYTMIVGMIVGTYSSVAVAAPIVYTKHAPAQHFTPDAERREEERLLPSSAGL
ncbi:MAG: protein translocase subunit SecD [Phycisphaerae bacterium]|nr:protein translocase subunit SecD [Phycisphaerae bacterium]